MTRALRDRCNGASQISSLTALIEERGAASLSATEVSLIDRAAARIGIDADLRIAYLGTHSLDPLPAYVRVHGLGVGLQIEDLTAPYGQYMQQLLAEDSELVEFSPSISFVSCSLRQIAPAIHDEFAELSAADLAAERSRVVEHMGGVADLALSRTQGAVVLANFPRPPYPAFGIADTKRDLGEAEFYLSLNLELLQRFKTSDRIHVMDLDRLVGGHRHPSAERLYYVAKSLWTDEQCNAIAQEMARYAVAITGRTRKCLVLDLDNTLWHGVVGEDGPDGVRVGQGTPAGEAFESFQHAARSLRRRGIVLALCSKNNPADAEEAFERRDDMPLKWQDFAVREIGWNDKASGIAEIAARLDIGEDSLVFADDNPAERAIVRGALPAVAVLEMPRDPAEYAEFLRRQPLFEKVRVNEDDMIRVDDYAARANRERLQFEAPSLDAYLSGLGTAIVVRPATSADAARVHELFNKTNQFNLTTRRYDLGGVERFISAPEFSLGVVSARDRFGAMGTVGVFLIEKDAAVARLDSFLMSCRALGRGIETAVMNCAKREAADRLGCTRMNAEFVPTAKNAPAGGFLDKQGFALASRDEGGVERYTLDLNGLRRVIPCEHVEVADEMGTSSAPRRSSGTEK